MPDLHGSSGRYKLEQMIRQARPSREASPKQSLGDSASLAPVPLVAAEERDARLLLAAYAPAPFVSSAMKGDFGMQSEASGV